MWGSDGIAWKVIPNDDVEALKTYLSQLESKQDKNCASNIETILGRALCYKSNRIISWTNNFIKDNKIKTKIVKIAEAFYDAECAEQGSKLYKEQEILVSFADFEGKIKKEYVDKIRPLVVVSAENKKKTKTEMAAEIVSTARWGLPKFDANNSLEAFLYSEHVKCVKNGRSTYRQFNNFYQRFCKEWQLQPVNLLSKKAVISVLEKYDLRVVDEVWQPESDGNFPDDKMWYILGVQLCEL